MRQLTHRINNPAAVLLQYTIKICLNEHKCFVFRFYQTHKATNIMSRAIKHRTPAVPYLHVLICRHLLVNFDNSNSAFYALLLTIEFSALYG